MEMSAYQCIAIEYQRSSLIRVVDYQTNKSQYNYQSYIQRDNIGDAQNFSIMVSIILSRDFSIETLIEI